MQNMLRVAGSWSISVVSIVLAAMLLLVGLSGFLYLRYTSSINAPDVVHIVVAAFHAPAELNSSPASDTPVYDVTITAVAQVQSVYQTMTKLQDAPRGVTYSCPVFVDYYTYSFQFKQAAMPTVHGSLNATGSPCDTLLLTYPIGGVTGKVVTASFFVALYNEASIPPPPQFPIGATK